MSELHEFGTIVLVVAAGFFGALGTYKLTERFPVPAPALFLVVAAVASDVFPGLETVISIHNVERIGVVALIVILFDGGMQVGWRRFRGAAFPITVLGVVGTFATAAVMAAFAHAFFGFDWTIAGILGAALAPTDPAVMFSVLGNREIGGRTGTILEGESGANDPVGIALMIGMLAYATSTHGSAWTVVREFALEMSIGLAVGVAGAWALLQLMRNVSLPNEGLYPLRTLAAAGVIYGIAAVAHGSGFLAVFVAGLLIGDARAPYKAEIERFHTSLASIAEIVVFTALGLTIHLTGLGDVWSDALLLAVLLVFVARPVVALALLLPAKLRAPERIFVAWGGLKGAVPILRSRSSRPCATPAGSTASSSSSSRSRSSYRGRRSRLSPPGSGSRCGSWSRSRGTSRSGSGASRRACSATSSPAARARRARRSATSRSASTLG
jgi:cell volume regulation protein A